MIILADDDADQRLVLRLALEQARFSVREAADGNEALKLQRERPARVLITDIFMPDKDGLELVQAFKREFPATKIIVISGGGRRASRDYLASVELMGVHATLQKPFNVESLLKMLRALIPLD
jgi:DNA-binding NtrC family response regulator